jgi:streptomycin 6-kinase
VDISAEVRRKVEALGDKGRRWVEDLPETVRRLEQMWNIAVRASFAGGSVAYVAGATTADDTPVVLKLAMPDGLRGNGDWRRELDAVRLGQGRGYVGLLAFDVDVRAMLLERLGPPIADLGLSIEEQISDIATTVSLGWQRPADTAAWRTGFEQAVFLGRCIDEWWQSLDEPCPRIVIETALDCVRRRADAFDLSTAVMIHGDAHSWNVLDCPAGGYRLIDPDGMLSEPAHDLAIPLRHWNDELLGELDPRERVRSWCERIQRTCADAQAIWDWAFAERVSTGLFLLRLGDRRGRSFLDVSERLST